MYCLTFKCAFYVSVRNTRECRLTDSETSPTGHREELIQVLMFIILNNNKHVFTALIGRNVAATMTKTW